MSYCHAPSRLNPSTLLTLSTVLLAVAGAVMLTGCGDAQSQGGKPGGMPGPKVGVITVQTSAVNLQTELPGRLEAWRTAQVRARVAGIVQKRLYTEGTEVKAGQSLYQLDDASFQAALAQAQAQQARAEAALAQAQAQYKRNEPLVQAKAISQQEWVATQAALKQAEADVQAGQAAVKSARVNVDYAAVRAPITGRVGRSTVTEGALVGPTDATALATIQQLDRLYVNVTQSAADLLRLQRALASGRQQQASGEQAGRVDVVMEDGSVYPLPGKLLFADQTVDPATGQVLLRAEVPNPKQQLLPGLFVKVRLSQTRLDNAVRLPQQAVSRAAAGDTVMVVGEGGQVQPRPVKVVGANGSDWVIESGLRPGEQVVVDGFQQMMMARGAPVTPVPWQSSAASGAAAAAAAAPASGAR